MTELRRALEEIVDMIANCADAPRDPASLPQAIKARAEKALSLDGGGDIQAIVVTSAVLAVYRMPSFTEREDAEKIGEACGLKFDSFEECDDGAKMAQFVGDPAAVAVLTANLGYGPQRMRRTLTGRVVSSAGAAPSLRNIR